MENGKFVVFEGGPGCGKTTQVNLFVEKTGWTSFREPGGTDFGEAIRTTLQENHSIRINRVASLFCYMATRANLIYEEISPRLKNRENVALDRYWTSTYAYQGAEGIDKTTIRQLAEIATGGLLPDLFIYYDLDPIIGQQRKTVAGQQQDRYDLKEINFLNIVRKNYHELGELFGPRWISIDAGKSIEAVHLETMNALITRGLIK